MVVIRRLLALLSRPHGHDGEIEQLIDGAWTDAHHGDWPAVERAVHALQARHPDAVLALVHEVCARALVGTNIADRARTVADLKGPDGLAAWLIIARRLDDTRGIRALFNRHNADQQRGIVVNLLRYACRQEAAR